MYYPLFEVSAFVLTSIRFSILNQISKRNMKIIAKKNYFNTRRGSVFTHTLFVKELGM